MVEEKLEGERVEEPQASPEKEPRPFLRRGSGLARYGGVGGPKNLTPKLKRSQSHRGSRGSLNSNGDSKLKASKSCPNVRDQQSVKPAANAKSIPRPQPTLKLKPTTNGTK